MDNAQNLQALLKRWPTLQTVWDASFCRKVVEQGRLPLWPHYLVDDPNDEELLSDLDKLEERLRRLSTVEGFGRLVPGLKSRSAETWSHTFLEVQVLEHLESAGILKEIQPALPSQDRRADCLIDIKGVQVWGEVTQFEPLRSARLSDGVTKLLRPEEEWRRRLPSLVNKLAQQLPAGNPAFAVINARRTIQRIETWDPVASIIFLQLPDIVGLVFRARSSTRFYKNPARYSDLAEALERYWGDHAL